MHPHEAEFLRTAIPALLLLIAVAFCFSRDNVVRCAGFIIGLATLMYLGARADLYSYRSINFLGVLLTPMLAALIAMGWAVVSTIIKERQKARDRRARLEASVSTNADSAREPSSV